MKMQRVLRTYHGSDKRQQRQWSNDKAMGTMEEATLRENAPTVRATDRATQLGQRRVGGSNGGD